MCFGKNSQFSHSPCVNYSFVAIILLSNSFKGWHKPCSVSLIKHGTYSLPTALLVYVQNYLRVCTLISLPSEQVVKDELDAFESAQSHQRLSEAAAAGRLSLWSDDACADDKVSATDDSQEEQRRQVNAVAHSVT